MKSERRWANQQRRKAGIYKNFSRDGRQASSRVTEDGLLRLSNTGAVLFVDGEQAGRLFSATAEMAVFRWLC
jgi:hypothetical protein